jgi:hypothetical protein
MLDTMTVEQLREYLSKFPANTKVAFSFPSGDYWQTQLVSPIQRGEYTNIKYDTYHKCYKVEDEESVERVLILR